MKTATDSTEEICNRLHMILPEFMDAYLLIGRTAEGEPIARFWAPDEKAAAEINQIVCAIARAGGVKCEEGT